MVVLSVGLRRELEGVCVRARGVAEGASRAALGALGVGEERVPAFLGVSERGLRNALRAKARQLGDADGSLELLVGECAFEQWHRLLFARFLAENGLLIHPGLGAPVTIAECEELAAGVGLDGWGLAAQFAAEILPGIFRLEDPCVQLPLAPEGRAALVEIAESLPGEVFRADDALGWVYQFWQKDKKDEVNASERKIGGADLGPVTQLFTENYMVRFLLENSLGAWWAGRHPDSPLLAGWEFLRFDEEGVPAAGVFESWPERVADVTVMDPCCGSGHFLVEAFGMLSAMRVEEEELSLVAAQDAVLRDNLFGLELDPRCVQIAMFAVALTAWKAGGGWRELPVPHIACSGLPVKAPVAEWKALAGGDAQLENALVRLHILFRDADTLGSLIDPKRAVEITDPTGLQSSFEDVDWDDIAPLLDKALAREADDPATAVLGADAAGIARAADYLSRHYTLITTNVPYLTAKRQSRQLSEWIDTHHKEARADLATAFVQRAAQVCDSLSVVTPENWLGLTSYSKFRERCLRFWRLAVLVRLGAGAFSSISGEVVKPLLLIASMQRAVTDHLVFMLDAKEWKGSDAKSAACRSATLTARTQASQLTNPDARFVFVDVDQSELLGLRAESWAGIQTGDTARFVRYLWEQGVPPGWESLQSTVVRSGAFGGGECVVRWDDGLHGLVAFAQSNRSDDVIYKTTVRENRGSDAWGKSGVVVSLLGDLAVCLYRGTKFDNNVAVLIPHAVADLPALWSFGLSDEFAASVRALDSKMNVTNRTLVKVPFDVERWRGVAAERFPDGLPEPWSDDPTQWLFEGRPEVSTDPLQVAVGRLLGFRWPEQAESDDLDVLADEDGIVCVPSVLGERPAADRLGELLARAFGGTWSSTRTLELLAASGAKKQDLESWLRDEFFKAHCQLFKNRPFVWQVWDGRKDGFSALVNYHRLDHATLERLTYTYLGDWIERQRAGVRDDTRGAEDRLAAALELQRRLVLILEGEPPLDIYVRWKSLAEQPIGWDPDLDDGVRLNVRPFVEAGVLRSKFNVKWDKDRGKNPDGSERINDLHYTNQQKQHAQGLV